MVFNFEFSAEDYLTFNLFIHKNSSLTAKRVLVFRIWIPILLLFLSGLIWISTKSYITISFVISAVVVCLGAKKMIFETTKMNVKKLIKSGKVNDHMGEVKLEFLDDIIRSEMKDRVTETKYSRIIKIEQDNTCLYIFIGEMTAYIMPLSVFKTDEEKENLISIINERRAKVSG